MTEFVHPERRPTTISLVRQMVKNLIIMRGGQTPEEVAEAKRRAMHLGIQVAGAPEEDIRRALKTLDSVPPEIAEDALTEIRVCNIGERDLRGILNPGTEPTSKTH